MTQAALELQKAIRGRLTAHAPLTAPVFDHVPQGTPEPFIYFGDIETRDWSTQTEEGHEHFVALHVRSGASGKKETQTMVGEIEAALDGAALTLAGHRLVNLRLTLWSVQRAGHAYHGLARLRAVTEPI